MSAPQQPQPIASVTRSDSLAELEPKALFLYFLELSKIPRGSKNESAAADWVAAKGRSLGCEVLRDEIGNVLIRKAASPGREQRKAVALQAHVDMVCEKNEGTQHDFLRDPIRVVREGDRLRAQGTTLGADNGVGVAAALAVLASDMHHGPLEVLVTIDEETGLTGANNLKPNWLRSEVLLNLDSEELGELTIGCAGGIDTIVSRNLTMVAPTPGLVALKLKVSGLKGGHSGVDIHLGRGNALRVLAQVLEAVRRKRACSVASVHGGNKRNAIAREANAVILVERDEVSSLRADVEQEEQSVRLAFGAIEPSVSISVSDADEPVTTVMSGDDANAVVGLLLAGPHGVEAMSPDIAGLVQTSTNMGRAETAKGAFEVCFLTRSSIDSSKWALAHRVQRIAELAGFVAEHEGGYPGWKPEPKSTLVTLINAAHERLWGKPMEIKAIHAGLECGLIGEKYPTMLMASIGPDIRDPHTPDESMGIQSVADFWKLLVAVLDAL